MSKAPRGLSPSEQALWARLAQSVTPLPGRKAPQVLSNTKPATLSPAATAAAAPSARPAKPGLSPVVPSKSGRKTTLPPLVPKLSPPPAMLPGALDSHWERRMKAGKLVPDLTLDLHDHSLDAAYARIMAGLDQARNIGARVVLIIAGRERPGDPADRGERRGAIRAKLLDWLAASHHAGAIVAVRKAHRSHGGEGALYLVLKRRG